GKHAFAPNPDWYTPADSISNCGPQAGTGGVCITPLYEGRITGDTPENQALIHRYLQTQAFVPTMQFTQIFDSLPACLIPWPLLSSWIPGRVAQWLDQLSQAATA